jgi:hypothetical protein
MWFDMRVADSSNVKEDKIAPMLMCLIYARRGFIPTAMHKSSTGFVHWRHDRKKCEDQYGVQWQQVDGPRDGRV